jgi:ribonuclease R/exosome complex exonuclease DIS3/RRP44
MRRAHHKKPFKKRAQAHPRTHTGVIDITRRGAGFVPHEDFEDDIKITPIDTKGALRGDEVQVHLYPARPGERRSGRVVRIVARARTQFVGTIYEHNNNYCIAPEGTPYTWYTFADKAEARKAINKKVRYAKTVF